MTVSAKSVSVDVLSFCSGTIVHLDRTGKKKNPKKSFVPLLCYNNLIREYSLFFLESCRQDYIIMTDVGMFPVQ